MQNFSNVIDRLGRLIINIGYELYARYSLHACGSSFSSLGSFFRMLSDLCDKR